MIFVILGYMLMDASYSGEGLCAVWVLNVRSACLSQLSRMKFDICKFSYWEVNVCILQ